jgi:hypothetical protein
MQYDLNAFYYAYSTIAQTLAGAFGFLMAVVLYQMQRLEASMEVSVKEFLGSLRVDSPEGSVTERYARCHDWDRVIDAIGVLHRQAISKVPTPDDGVRGFAEAQGAFISLAHTKLQTLHSRARHALLWTCFTIACSVALIVVTPFLTYGRNWLGLPFLVLVMGFFVYCLNLYWRLASRLVEKRPRSSFTTSPDGSTRASSIACEPWDA